MVASYFKLTLRFEIFIFFRAFEFLNFGVYFAIILGVAKSVFSFVVILVFIVFAYAHAFYILLHPTKKFDALNPVFDDDKNNPWNLATTYNPINNGAVVMNESLISLPNLNTNLYEYFGTALLAVYKLMTGIIKCEIFLFNETVIIIITISFIELLGDTSSLAVWEYYNNITLVFLWITFSFFMVIYLLNLFIGLLNIAIQDNNSRILFLLQKAEVLAEIELFYLFPCQRRWKSWFPDKIFYYAHVDKLKNKLSNIKIIYSIKIVNTSQIFRNIF
ncbi:hypothetical protein C2G38_1626409 [Gigaspora rosea]|uniref:Ion transport domain-containing protein n=1 Tax=Gigaspora rosea TaxID=44941 RepID=A0A397W7E4_9GLOM|nr:hypothetical protein C2G38_1626409 [Gigaspora rosea]